MMAPAMHAHEAPAAVHASDLIEGGGGKPAPLPVTTYCCGRCRSATCCCGRLRCSPPLKRKCVGAVVVFAAAAVVGIVCGVYFGLLKNEVKLTVSALAGSPVSVAGAAHAGRRLLQSGGLLPSSAVPSATESAYAQVDALNLNVAYARFASTAGGGHDLASTDWGASKGFTLRSGVNTVPLTATVENMAPGSYFAADFVFWNRWSIQAFCRTANAFLYTTAAGVVSLPSAPSVMPSDYGALTYDNMPGAEFIESTNAATSTDAQNHMSFINSVYNYDVDASSTVNLMLDSSYVVSCYDGTTDAAAVQARGPADGMLYPMGADMTYGNRDPRFTRVFDWTSPQFGFSSWTLPVFVQVTTGSGGIGAGGSVGETYAFALNAAWLPMPGGPPADWSKLAIATLTWSSAAPDAILLDMRVRGSSAGFPPSFGVMGGFMNFTSSPGAGGALDWSFYNGQQYYMSYNYIAERAFSGFSRTLDFTTIGNLSVGDGPQCGTDPGSGPGQPGQANPCLGTSVAFAYVQLPRIT